MLDQDTLKEIITRIVDVVEPEKIILFGSAARGRAGRHSDIDLLVIKDGGDSLDLMTQIYGRLHGVGAAVDAIVVSLQDVERFRDSHALVIKPALQHGKVVYESPENLALARARFEGVEVEKGLENRIAAADAKVLLRLEDVTVATIPHERLDEGDISEYVPHKQVVADFE